MRTCSWSGSVVPGAHFISAVTNPVALSNKRPFTSQPANRVFFHSISDGRTVCEWLSAMSCLALGVTASMAVPLSFIVANRLAVSRHYSRSRLSPLQPGLADRRLEGKAGIPGKVDPGVLRHFGDKGVDHRPSHRLGVDGGE